MIQRIQSLYLFILYLLIGFLFLLPFAEIAKDGAVYLFNYKGVLLNEVLKENGIVIPVLLVVIMVLHGFALFSFKIENVQVQFVFLQSLSILILLGVFVFFHLYFF